MSIFDKKSEEKKEQSKINKKFAFPEDKNFNNEFDNLDDFVKSGRGQNKTSLNSKGRPKLDEENLKNETVMIYLTREQKEQLQEKAKKASLSVSKYILVKVFGID